MTRPAACRRLQLVDERRVLLERETTLPTCQCSSRNAGILVADRERDRRQTHRHAIPDVVIDLVQRSPAT